MIKLIFIESLILKKMKDRLQQSTHQVQNNVTNITERYQKISENDEKLQTAQFLIESRKDIKKIRKITGKVITLEDVKTRFNKAMRRKKKLVLKSITTSSSESSTQSLINKYKNEEEDELENVKSKVEEFKILDKLMYILYIKKYFDHRKQKNQTISRKSNVVCFESLKFFYDRQSVINMTIDDTFSNNIFESTPLLALFLNKCEIYNGYYHQTRDLTEDDIIQAATNCIEIIIEMNSRAKRLFNDTDGDYYTLIYAKNSKLKALTKEKEFFENEHKILHEFLSNRSKSALQFWSKRSTNEIKKEVKDKEAEIARLQALATENNQKYHQIMQAFLAMFNCFRFKCFKIVETVKTVEDQNLSLSDSDSSGNRRFFLKSAKIGSFRQKRNSISNFENKNTLAKKNSVYPQSNKFLFLKPDLPKPPESALPMSKRKFYKSKHKKGKIVHSSDANQPSSATWTNRLNTNQSKNLLNPSKRMEKIKEISPLKFRNKKSACSHLISFIENTEASKFSASSDSDSEESSHMPSFLDKPKLKVFEEPQYKYVAHNTFKMIATLMKATDALKEFYSIDEEDSYVRESQANLEYQVHKYRLGNFCKLRKKKKYASLNKRNAASSLYTSRKQSVRLSMDQGLEKQEVLSKELSEKEAVVINKAINSFSVFQREEKVFQKNLAQDVTNFKITYKRQIKKLRETKSKLMEQKEFNPSLKLYENKKYYFKSSATAQAFPVSSRKKSLQYSNEIKKKKKKKDPIQEAIRNLPFLEQSRLELKGKIPVEIQKTLNKSQSMAIKDLDKIGRSRKRN
ncbi:unnamed protein product [Moneuplotes crassus]|uniref:Uncharacterized protein n=1 Tax=Euplotes crassus TaxID=5936 RepID=A0AAD1Y5F2_EUPCR|nr:unnamed protein product [Moneuplotes crassus]